MTWLLLFFWFHACLPDRNRAGLMKKPKRELDIGELKWGRRRKREHDPDHSWFLPLASVSNGPLWTHGHDADTSAPHYKEDLKPSESSADYLFLWAHTWTTTTKSLNSEDAIIIMHQTKCIFVSTISANPAFSIDQGHCQRGRAYGGTTVEWILCWWSQIITQSGPKWSPSDSQSGS